MDVDEYGMEMEKRRETYNRILEIRDRGKIFEYITTNLAQEELHQLYQGPFTEKTLLHIVCEDKTDNSTKAIVYLLKQGLDPDGKTKGCNAMPPILNASQFNHKNIKILLVAGANIFAIHENRLNALTVAMNTENYESVNILVRNGLSVPKSLAISLPWGYHFKQEIVDYAQKREETYRSCRNKVIILLGIKRKRPLCLAMFDKYLVREVGLAIWSMR